MNILPMIEELIDTIFDPVVQLLETAVNALDGFAFQPARLLKLDYFLGPISKLGPEWRTLISLTLSTLSILLIITIVQSCYSLYVKLKDGVKWW